LVGCVPAEPAAVSLGGATIAEVLGGNKAKRWKPAAGKAAVTVNVCCPWVVTVPARWSRRLIFLF
jgi:hypothetical protein